MNRTIALAVVLVLGTVVTAVMGCREARLKERLAAAEQNVAALADSTRYERNRAGELEAVRRTLAADKNGLQVLNAELHAELVKERGKVKTITRTVVVVERDTVEAPGVTIGFTDSVAAATFAFHEEHPGGSRHLEGETRIWPDSSSTKLTRDELSLVLVGGTRERDGLREMFVRTSFPGVDLYLEGAEIKFTRSACRNKPWGIGPSVAFGYSPEESQWRYLIGVGLTRSIIRW